MSGRLTSPVKHVTVCAHRFKRVPQARHFAGIAPSRSVCTCSQIRWNRGIGTACLKTMAAHLKACKMAGRTLLDPHKGNYRALRTHEKAGFRIMRSLPERELFERKETSASRELR